MQTHEDSDVPREVREWRDQQAKKLREPFDFKRLEDRAKKIVSEGGSEITAGKPGEPVLAQWKSEGVYVTQRPDDEQGILRISVGGGLTSVDLNYCVFRGDRVACAELLAKAVEALRTPR